MKKFCFGILHFLCGFVAVFAVGAFVLAYYIAELLPDSFLVEQGTQIKVAGMPFILAEKEKAPFNSAVKVGVGDADEMFELTIGGVIPIKTVRAKQTLRRAVTVCGTPFGIKMFANGAMVVSFSDIYTDNGYQNPAKTAGLKLGDVILSIAGKKTKTNEDVAKCLQDISGAPAQVVYMRDGVENKVILTAVKDLAGGLYRAGMWVRDSSAGIGTLTFVDNSTGIFAGLGHPIHDVDTGKTIGLGQGEIVNVSIGGYVKGEAGKPGELKGRFLSGIATGNITANGADGVYGNVVSYKKGVDMELALPQEVTPGVAQMITTINGETPIAYNVEIEKLDFDNEKDRNMVVHITDERILSTTGGIVQGMSGSPLVQNGRLIGAVTHVLVNDPTRGFAIFAETMLDTADSLSAKKNAA